MLLQVSILVLASQLVHPVADGVPQFNIERGCKIDSTATSLDVGLNESPKNCVRDEKQARAQLQSTALGSRTGTRRTSIKDDQTAGSDPNPEWYPDGAVHGQLSRGVCRSPRP